MKKDDQTYLSHIWSAILRMESYLQGVDFDIFSNDLMRVAAVCREFEIIGEASKNISFFFKQKNPQLPWRPMKDMRNFLIHRYFGVSEKVVWGTYVKHIPKLKQLLIPLLKN